MTNYCPALQDWSSDAVNVFIDYRITIAIVVFLIFNVLSTYLKDVRLPMNPAYPKMSDKDKEMLSIRTMQFIFGIIIAFSGYTSALVDLSIGCRFLLKPWAFWAGGGILTLFDFHEFGARWPLPSHVLVHHIAVFTIALFYIEYSVLDEVQFPTVIFVANIGFCWVTDYAHVIFRTSQRLTHIVRARKAYLILSPPIRLVNICLISGSAVFSAIAKNWLLFGVNLFMAIAYVWNTYKAVLFVINFDCEKYYNTHQKIWLGRDHSLMIPSSDVKSSAQLGGRSSGNSGSSFMASLKSHIWVQGDDFFDESTNTKDNQVASINARDEEECYNNDHRLAHHHPTKERESVISWPVSKIEEGDEDPLTSGMLDNDNYSSSSC